MGAKARVIVRADAAQDLHRQGSSRPYGETLTHRNGTSMYNAPRSERNVAYQKLDCCTLVGFSGWRRFIEEYSKPLSIACSKSREDLAHTCSSYVWTRNVQYDMDKNSKTCS